MKRALALFTSLGVAVIALLFTAQPAHTQGTISPAPLVNVTTGGGLTKTGQKVGMLSTCGTNEILKWSGSAWACAADSSGGLSDGDKGDVTVSSSGSVWTIDNNVVSYAKMQDVSATNRILCRKTAGAGDPEECTASDVNTMISASNIAVGSGLSLGGINGPQTCSSGTCTMTISARDFGDITASASGASWTIDNGTVTAPKLSIDGDKGDVTIGSSATTFNVDNDAITYAKMQNVSATSRILCRKTAGAGDVEECTGSDAATIIGGITGSGTSNLVARWTGTGTLGTGQITDDNTNEVKVGAGPDAATRSDTILEATNNGDTSLSVRNSFDNTEAGVIAGGSLVSFGSVSNTNLSFIYANASVATYTGAGWGFLDNTSVTGTLTSSGAVTFNAAGNTMNELTLSGTFSSNGTSTNLSNGTGDQVTIGGGELRDTGAAPSSFTCGTGAAASGGRNWFRVTVGTSPTATCAITFSTAFGATPTCTVSRGNSSARPDSYISSLSSSSLTISNDAGATLTTGAIYHVHCGG